MAINYSKNISKVTSAFTRKLNHYADQVTKQNSEQITETSASELTKILKGRQRSLN